MRLYSPHYKYTMYTTPKSGCTFFGPDVYVTSL